jgi:hypothetical protein
MKKDTNKQPKLQIKNTNGFGSSISNPILSDISDSGGGGGCLSVFALCLQIIQYLLFQLK